MLPKDVFKQGDKLLMAMPNFLIIGAAKSGTTALYEYLKQHPQIYMSPVKEPKFFGLDGERLNFKGPGDEKANRTIVTDIRAYKALFDDVSNEKAIGEASPWYIYLENAPRQIQAYIPKVKLIAILRNPVDRAYSNFLQQANNREPFTDFSQALQEENKRIRNNWRPHWHYKQLGFYHVQLSRYFKVFDRSQIKVYLYRDFCNNSVGVLRDIFQFLDVDDSFIPNVSKRYNVTSVSKERPVSKLLNQPSRAISTLQLLLPQELGQSLITTTPKENLVKSQLSPEIRRQLIEDYRDDILKLQLLIEQDISHWLSD